MNNKVEKKNKKRSAPLFGTVTCIKLYLFCTKNFTKCRKYKNYLKILSFFYFYVFYRRFFRYLKKYSSKKIKKGILKKITFYQTNSLNKLSLFFHHKYISTIFIIVSTIVTG